MLCWFATYDPGLKFYIINEFMHLCCFLIYKCISTSYGIELGLNYPLDSEVDYLPKICVELYCFLIINASHCSLHGLVRGENMELGRDSDTGGQVMLVHLSKNNGWRLACMVAQSDLVYYMVF